MKSTNRLLSMILGAAIIFGASSCKNDEPDIPQGGDGIAVADGYYITQEGVDPASTSQLSSETVEDDGFGAQDREGFYGGYVYLTAGNYVVVNIVEKAISESYGGSKTSETEETKVCAVLNYNLIAAAKDVSAFSVDSEGLYKVTYDTETSEIVYVKIETTGIIGDATTIGWTDGETIDIPGSVSADGGSWSATDISLRGGQFKIRFNCSWFIDRRIDPSAGFLVDNGYMLHTNFGGTTTELIHGNDGSGIPISAVGGGGNEDGVYTVDITWTPEAGFALALTRTGDNIPLPTYSETMFMVGDALNGWGLDTGEGIAMTPVHSNPHLFWGIAWVQATGGFKFAPAEVWANDFGKTGSATNGVYGTGSDNVPAPAIAGYYMIVVNLEVGAETIEINKPLIYGIGDAFGSWDAGMNLFTEDIGNQVMTSPAFTVDANMRMYTTATTFTPVDGGPAVDWWQAEFTVLSGLIEYRGTGGDQTGAPVTAGQTVSLKFVDGTGSVQ